MSNASVVVLTPEKADMVLRLNAECWRRPGIEPFRRPFAGLAGGGWWRLGGVEVAMGATLD